MKKKNIFLILLAAGIAYRCFQFSQVKLEPLKRTEPPFDPHMNVNTMVGQKIGDSLVIKLTPINPTKP